MIEMGAPSSFLKFAWAQHHLEALKEEVRRFEEDQPAVIMAEFKPKRPGYDLVLRVRRQTPDRIPLLAGDVIGCLRDALDHVIYELSFYNSSGSPPHKTAWPICEYRSQWPMRRSNKSGVNNHSGEFKVQSIPREARARAYRHQPFYRKRSPGPHRHHPLWVLDELRNIDKHRRLNIMPVVGVGFSATVATSVPIVRQISRRKAASDGTVVERTWLTPGARESDVSVKAVPAVKICLDEPSAFQPRVSLIPMLDWLVKQVGTVLMNFAEFQPDAAKQFMEAGPFQNV